MKKESRFLFGSLFYILCTVSQNDTKSRLTVPYNEAAMMIKHREASAFVRMRRRVFGVCLCATQRNHNEKIFCHDVCGASLILHFCVLCRQPPVRKKRAGFYSALFFIFFAGFRENDTKSRLTVPYSEAVMMIKHREASAFVRMRRRIFGVYLCATHSETILCFWF